MEEWKEYKLGEITDIQTGPFGSQLHQRDYVDVGTPCIMPTNIGTHLDIKPEGIAHVKEEDVARLNKHCVKTGDIIYSRRGDIEKCAFISKHEEGWLCGTGCLRIRINSLSANPHFIAYQLSTKECKKWIVGNAVGTTMLNLNTGILKELPLLMPDRQLQDSVVKILQSLDDKIEVNRRINDNLEQQAQALFKSWFVDFEPFKDCEFVESELGMIPKGWRVGKLGELCQFKRGKGLLSKNAIPGDVPVVAGGLEPACYHNISNTKAPVITVSGSGANAGFMRMYHQEVWASDCSFIDITCENWLFVYCFLAINSHLLKHAQTGAVQPHVKPADIHDFDLAIPPKEYIQRFQDKISSFITKKGLIEQESRRLAELRDALLPKLMSGELKVNELNI